MPDLEFRLLKPGIEREILGPDFELQMKNRLIWTVVSKKDPYLRMDIPVQKHLIAFEYKDLHDEIKELKRILKGDVDDSRQEL